MGLAAEDELQGPPGIIDEPFQPLQIGKDQVGPLVDGKPPGKANGQDRRVEQGPAHDHVAHPADDPGKLLLQKILTLAQDRELGGRIAFVEDYGAQQAYYLVQGVDVWLNNPRPPLEACGTSGMKAALNGVLHLSILDGWWPEGFNGKNGWAFGGEPAADAIDAAALYALLEKEVAPLYYQIDEEGIPLDWVQMMKESMKSIGPAFSARRMVKEYTTKFYDPALTAAGK